MSTVPGEGTWRDAGLDEPVAIDDPVEYTPDDPRPELEGAADPADAAEQRIDVPVDEGEEYPG